jgi:hypothetical protein
VRTTEGFHRFNNTKGKKSTASHWKISNLLYHASAYLSRKTTEKEVGGRGNVEGKGGVAREDVEVGEMEVGG